MGLAHLLTGSLHCLQRNLGLLVLLEFKAQLELQAQGQLEPLEWLEMMEQLGLLEWLDQMAQLVQQGLEPQVQLAPLEHPHLPMFKSSPHLELGRSQQEQGQ
jgi:hypothetical protein